MPDVFAVPVFLIVFRETLETVIIVSILLAFLKQTLDGPDRDVVVYKKLVRQVRCSLDIPHPTQHLLLNTAGSRSGSVLASVS